MSEFNQHVKTVLEKHIHDESTVNAIALDILNPFGGTPVYVSIPFEERNKQIKNQYRLGVSAKKIAREFSLTERSVYKIVKNFR